MDEYTIEELEQIMRDGTVEVGCTNPECDLIATIEPDGDYQCYQCGVGRLTSPLVLLGLI